MKFYQNQHPCDVSCQLQPCLAYALSGELLHQVVLPSLLGQQDIIEEFMVKDLIGPVAEDEVLDESPLNYYLMGKLYPQADIESDAITKEEGDINRNAILENELDGYDTSISLSNVRNPSSMGITCAINSEVR